ncbi:hypothetical protein CHPC1148_0025 [Streptococcus phage CHPC1148]|uniref:Uncharacterized protein n=1 Tax=Streptococcus phage CHPC1148 TaxID=2365028 RepID=A0A3G8FDR7_9CAUD|nr:hypothetical protein PP205_gp25 [Streptococcus phage CHPC1148]AZF92012.1 hypothetical protein CHPC1148_0025 [Streptococcus phage CHPC1148]
MIKTEMIDDILTLIEEIDAISDKSKETFFEKIDELETNLQALNRQITDELVEILQEDYSDNWVAKEVIELVTNS